MSSPDMAEDREFRAFYDRHNRHVLAYCLRRAGRWDAYDAVADTFLVAWRRWDGVPQGDVDARAWLYGVAYRALANRRRADGRRDRLTSRLESTSVAPLGGLEDVVADREIAGRVLGALERLDEPDRELLRLVAWEELSHREIGLALGCSANAVAQRLYRARARLRRELGRRHVRRGLAGSRGTP